MKRGMTYLALAERDADGQRGRVISIDITCEDEGVMEGGTRTSGCVAIGATLRAGATDATDATWWPVACAPTAGGWIMPPSRLYKVMKVNCGNKQEI